MSQPTYQSTVEYLYAALPMYQRVGSAAYKADLKNTVALCQALDNPQHQFKSIHVGGTNGKGSSAHMIAAILQSEGYKTGLYTSPHLKGFTERIKINGVEIPPGFVVDFVQRIKPLIETLHPSFFEITVAMCFDYFARQQVDFAVIEVGLGGRLDSTNVICPLVSLITNIGYDHKDILGDTLALIAGEKAGIIKPNGIAVISERQKEVEEVFINKARMVGSTLHFAEDTFQIERLEGNSLGFEVRCAGDVIFPSLFPELKGGYQQKNLAGVLKAVEALKMAGYPVSQGAIEKGIAKTITLTGLKGRWQQLGEAPKIYCDTAHNAEGMLEVLKMIDSFSYGSLHIVLGVVKDKDPADVLSLMPRQAHYYFCQAAIPRALPAHVLRSQASEFGLKGSVVPDVNEAIGQAKAAAAPSDLIFVGGSTYVVAEIDGL